MSIFNITKQLIMRCAVFFVDSFFPVECLECGAPHQWLCDDCRQKIKYYQNQECPICRKISPWGMCCASCHSYLDGVMIMTSYKDLIKRAIIACKYNFATEVGEELGEMLTKFFSEQKWLKENTLLIAMPLSRHRFNWRGFNQSEILAEKIAESCGFKINITNFLKIKDTPPQAKLNWQERFNIEQDCFKWTGESLKDKIVILIDDVMTTGTTLESTAKVLKLAGAEKVWGLVIARGK